MNSGQPQQPFEIVDDWRFEQPVLRMFTVAHQVTVQPQPQGVMVAGAGVQWVSMETPGQFAPLGMALMVGLPSAQAGLDHLFQLRVLNSDRQPVGAADPYWWWKGRALVNPGVDIGEEVDLRLAIDLHLLKIDRPGTIYFHVLVDGDRLGVLPFRIRALTEEDRRRARAAALTPT